MINQCSLFSDSFTKVKGLNIINQIQSFFFIPLIFVLSQLFGQSVDVPVDHRVYDFLSRMEVRGLLPGQNNTFPWTRSFVSQSIFYLDSIFLETPHRFSDVEIQFLDRFKSEFFDELKDTRIDINPADHEPHLLSWRTEEKFVHFDALFGASYIHRNKEIAREGQAIKGAYYGGILRGEVNGLGFYSDNRIYSEWGREKYIESYNSSYGYPVSTSKDSTQAIWDVTNAYLCTQIRSIRLLFGRQFVRWGPSKFGGLMLSGLAPAFDLFKIDIPFGKAQFTWLHGELRSQFSHKWIAAHRIDWQISSRFSLGLNESLIYGDCGIEMAYLNPIIPYLIAEHTLGDRDNVALGFDFDWLPGPDITFYGEVFIDDLFAPWEIFSDFYGNKLAFTLGLSQTNPLFLKDGEFQIEYTRIEPYVYTHKEPVNVYENYNIGLGHFPEPNSDLLSVEYNHLFSLYTSGSIFCYQQRHGAGDHRVPHQKSDGNEKQFLDGIVETKRQIGFSLFYEFFRDIWLSFEVSKVYAQNLNLIQSNDDDWVTIRAEGHVNW